MTELRRVARHAAAHGAAPVTPDGVEPDEVWVPPPYEPSRPGDFVEFATTGFQVRRKHGGLVFLLVLLLAAALGGGWWYLHRSDSAPSAMSCQDVYAGLPSSLQHDLRMSAGGQLPQGIPLPLGKPGSTCAVSNKSGAAVMVDWPGATEADYATLLGAGGWTSSRNVNGYTLYVNGGDHRGVVTTTVNGQLIVFYDR